MPAFLLSYGWGWGWAGMISKVNQGQFLQTQKRKTIFIQLYKPGKRPAGRVFLVDAEKVKKILT